jgi:hypothetical protein
MAVELVLLLPAVDVQLAGMGVFTDPRRARIGFRLLEAQPRQVGFDLGQTSGGRCLAFARLGQSRPCQLDGVRQLAIAAGEQHLFPPPQLVAQPAVAPRLGRLPLQRAALLLDLEDDVVDAGEVLLRGFELELGRPAPRLVFRDPRRLLNQLPAIGRPRTEDHPDLALLDDRVGLGAQAGVHQQFVHVTEPAGLAVDEILALP